MKIIILLSVILIINSADIETCQCLDLLTEFDCDKAFTVQVANQDMLNMKVCFWYEGSCIDIRKDIDIPCSQLTQTQCKNFPTCAWYQNKCRTFTQCSDYKFEKSILSSSCDDLNCLENGTSCTFDVIGRQEQNCEEIANEEECQRIYLLYKKTICNWTGSACVGQQLSTCSSLTEQQCLQANSQCAWKDSKCTKRTCSDGQYPFYQNEGVKLCSSYLDIETNQVQYCSLDEDGLCVTIDPEDLDRRNCYSQSFQQYKWNPEDNECQSCF